MYILIRALILVIAFSTLGGEQVELYSSRALSSNLSLIYEPSERKIIFKYKKGFFDDEKSLSFNIQDTSSIDMASAVIEEKVREEVLEGVKFEELLAALDRVKVMNGTQCNIVLFEKVTPTSADELGPLVEGIANKLKDSEEATQKTIIHTFEIEGVGEVSLRAHLNEKLEVNGFSLFSDKVDISDLNIKKENDFFQVHKSGTQLLSLRLLDNRKKLVLYRPNSSNPLLSQNTTLELEVNKRGLSSKVIFDSSSSVVEQKRRLELSFDSVEHKKVLRVDKGEDYFKSLEQDELSFLNSLRDEDFEKVQNEFGKCIFNYFSKGSFENVDSPELRRGCRIISELNSLLDFNIDMNVLLAKEGQYTERNLKNNFYQCLHNNGFFEDSSEVKVALVPMSIAEEDIRICLEKLNKSVELSEIENGINNDSRLQGIFLTESNSKFFKEKSFEEFSKCRESLSFQECRNHLNKSKIRFAFDTFLKDRSERKLLSKTMEQALSDSFKKCDQDQSCMISVLKKLSHSEGSSKLQYALNSILPGENFSFNARDERNFKRRFDRCLEEKFFLGANENEFLESIESFSRVELECEFVTLKSLIPEIFTNSIVQEDSYINLEEEQREHFKTVLKRYLKSTVGDLKDVSGLRKFNDEIKEDSRIIYSEFYVLQRLTDSNLDRSKRKEIEEKVHSMLLGDRKMSLSSKVKYTLRIQASKGREISGHTLTNQVLKEAELLVYKEENQVSEDAFIDCFSNYSPTWTDISFNDYLINCKEKKKREDFFLSSKDKLEHLVSKDFDLLSTEANNILSPLHYFESCIEKLPSFNSKSVNTLAEMNGCYEMAQFEIEKNISDMLIATNKPILKDQGKAALNVNEICYENTFLFLAGLVKKSSVVTPEQRELFLQSISPRGDIDLIKIFKARESNTNSRGLLESYTHGDSKTKSAIQNLLIILGNNEIVPQGWLEDHLSTCKSNVDNELFNSFRTFIQDKIHLDSKLGRDSFNNANHRRLITHVFNNDLLNELLILTRKKSFGSDIGETDIANTEVTGELGTAALGNLISVLGEFLKEGLIFDPESMETELITFRSELVRALRWLNKQNGEVKLSELKNFFESTRLADILAYAVVSKNVRNIFDDYIKKEQRRQEQILLRQFKKSRTSDFSSSERVKWQRMTSRFDQLRIESRKMTSSYDFKRLFRDGSEESRKKLDRIKKNYLLPLIASGRVSNEAERETLKMVSELVVKDDANGGFAERFAATAAKEFLQNDNDSHWGITKFFFYDDHDFDWTTLRNTPSGSKAINYYTKSILMPEVTGQKLSEYTKNSRMRYFNRLLDKAQSENDD
ncbi:hypothetical protein BIY24_13500 [Halobacteriovorax marinus]|uniref:hypothetical protein n=1 Tax=Halobacteriovorax marinus TaxID=97084 RepID=UPI000BC2C5B5|nr:hypothetical protein [Halobacteriovorax marinus]ATH08925.1 hypothetical protein BIY24_13500 [Halobacteriovorax marinus]